MIKPRFTMPEILTTQLSPLPSIASLKGATWWAKKRKEAEDKNNGCCWACGVHKSRARIKKYLEGHELLSYIDRETRMAVLQEVCVLCFLCHRFCHLDKTLVGNSDFAEHGFSVLRTNGIDTVPAINAFAWLTDNYDINKAIEIINNKDTYPPMYDSNPQDTWRLEIEGVVYTNERVMEYGYYGV